MTGLDTIDFPDRDTSIVWAVDLRSQGRGRHRPVAPDKVVLRSNDSCVDQRELLGYLELTGYDDSRLVLYKDD